MAGQCALLILHLPQPTQPNLTPDERPQSSNHFRRINPTEHVYINLTGNTCVVTLVDRLVHHAEIVQIQADSYRLKEAKDDAAQKARQRDRRRKKVTSERPTKAQEKK